MPTRQHQPHHRHQRPRGCLHHHHRHAREPVEVLGLLSDTRVAASLVDLCGTDVLDRLPGRWVFFDRDFTELYGEWREWQGMRASYLYFLPVLSDRPPRSPPPLLRFTATCGIPDTRNRRK